MSVQTKLDLIQDDIDRARAKIVDMGGGVTVNGGSSQLADDIGTIPKGDPMIDYITYAQIDNKTGLPETFEFSLPNAVLRFSHNTGCKNVILNIASLRVDRYQTFNNCSDIEYVKWNGAISGTDGRDFFRQCIKLHTIDCEMDVSTINSYGNFFYNSPALTNFRFKPNSIKVNLPLSFSPSATVLANPDFKYSLISMANGLDENATGKSFATNNANLRTQFSSITGTVNSNNLFEYDASGTMTLADFVTNVKGWSIA